MSGERRVGGVLGAGAVTMIVGVVVLTSTGADLWGAPSDGTIGSYVAESGG